MEAWVKKQEASKKDYLLKFLLGFERLFLSKILFFEN